MGKYIFLFLFVALFVSFCIINSRYSECAKCHQRFKKDVLVGGYCEKCAEKLQHEARLKDRASAAFASIADLYALLPSAYLYHEDYDLQSLPDTVTKYKDFSQFIQSDCIDSGIVNSQYFRSVFDDRVDGLLLRGFSRRVFVDKSAPSYVSAYFSSLKKEIDEKIFKLEHELSQSESFASCISSLPRLPVVINEGAAPHVHSGGAGDYRMINITRQTPDDLINEYYVVDVETTGLSAYVNEIVQLAAVHFVDFTPVDCFCTYVKPRKGINPEAQAVNGISEEMVADAPYIEEIMDFFDDYVGKDVPIIGHNVSFDLKFLHCAGSKAITESRRYHDTLPLARRTYVSESYKLDFLGRYELLILRDDAHDSLSDALLSGILFEQECRHLRL